MGQLRFFIMSKLLQNHYKRLFLLLLSILMVSCATPTKKPKEDPATRDIEIIEEYGVDADVKEKFNKSVKLISDEKYDEAITLLLEVVARSTKHSAPYVNLGIAYSKLGKIVEAEESLLKALKVTPTHPVTNNELALVYRKSGRFEEAKNIYQNVIKVYPQFLPVRKNLGILCDLFMNDLDCAIENYEAYLKIKPDHKKIKIWLIDLKRRAGKK